MVIEEKGIPDQPCSQFLQDLPVARGGIDPFTQEIPPFSWMTGMLYGDSSRGRIVTGRTGEGGIEASHHV